MKKEGSMKIVAVVSLLVGVSASAQGYFNQQRIGNQQFGHGYVNGNTINSHSMNIGRTQFHTYDVQDNNGYMKQTNCTTQTIGSQQFTNCY